MKRELSAEERRLRVDLREVAQVIDARPLGGAPLDDGPCWTGGGSIDTRKVEKGQIFFALRGTRTDGHFFVDDALGAGAVAAVVETGVWRELHGESAAPPPADSGGGVILGVPEVEAALQTLARWHRSRMDPRVIAVTGTAGKTSAKEYIAAVLSGESTVLATKGNLNNQLGLPLTLLELDPAHELAVVELGASRPGDIAFLVEMARPEIGVITAIGEAHLEFFGSVETVLAAKWELAEYLGSAGALVLNGDDPLLAARRQDRAGRTITYGFGSRVDLRGTDPRPVDPDRFPPGASLRVEGVEVRLQQLGRGALYAGLASLAVARHLGIPLGAAAAALAEIPPLPGRLCPLSVGEITLIDDTYNASPAAVANALEVLAEWPARGRRMAVLGDMLELGSASERAHREIGRLAFSAGVELLFLWGSFAEATAEGARQAGMIAESIRQAPGRDELAREVSREMKPGDVILLKASRGGRLEQVAATLMQRDN